jgi:hypothetical protein
MKIALLGAAGFLGGAAAQELSRRAEVHELILVDYVIRDAKRLAKALSPKCRWAMADVGKPVELSRLLEGIDAVASAVGPCAEYEKTILLACAGMGVAAASAGDGTLPEADRREIDAAFRAAGVPAVSGCAMMPGWTELLSAHFLAAGARTARHLFFSPDRFGGYAFLRGVARGITGPAPPPRGSAGGSWFSLPDGSLVGVPEGKVAGRFRRITGTAGKLGPLGKEFSAALLLWLRGSMSGRPGVPAAVAGVSSGDRYARVEDPSGRLAALTLVEAAVRLAARPRKHEGLLPLPGLIGREEAERLSAAAGARIETGG